jgi:hypothetical protein
MFTMFTRGLILAMSGQTDEARTILNELKA